MVRLSGILRNLFIQLLIFFGLLLCVEVILHFWLPFNHDAVQRQVSQNLPGLKAEITYQSGRYGLRSLQAINTEKPGDQLRILCLGASTTEQTTQETQDTWCGILETALKARLGEHAERLQTMAFGIGGYRAIDNAFWLREHLELIKPDIVISLLGINDLAWNGGEDYAYAGLEAEFAQRAKHRSSDLMRGCKHYSQLCRRLSHIKQLIGTQLAVNRGEVVEWHSDNLPKLRAQYRSYPLAKLSRRNPDPFAEFREATNWLARYLQQRKITLLMLGQPVLWKANMPPSLSDQLWFSVSTTNGPVRPEGEWLQQEMARYNLAQKEIALQSGAYYRNLDALIPKSLDYYFDDCHFTDQGSRKVAMSILPVLSELVDKAMHL